jgi:hypothetical protein
MAELDLVTVAALERLKLYPDRLPPDLRRLAELTAKLTPPEEWTWDHTAAYRHLRQVVGDARKPDAAPAKPDGPKPRGVPRASGEEWLDKAPAGLSARQVRPELCAS